MKNFYLCFQELNYNFHSIILPEALKWMQTEHPDMLSMVSELDDIVKDAGLTLDELQKQLKLHLRCLIMGMKVMKFLVVFCFVSNVEDMKCLPLFAVSSQRRSVYRFVFEDEIRNSATATL